MVLVASFPVNTDMRYTVVDEGDIPYWPFYAQAFAVNVEMCVMHESLPQPFWLSIKQCQRFSDKERALQFAIAESEKARGFALEKERQSMGTDEGMILVDAETYHSLFSACEKFERLYTEIGRTANSEWTKRMVDDYSTQYTAALKECVAAVRIARGKEG